MRKGKPDDVRCGFATVAARLVHWEVSLIFRCGSQKRMMQRVIHWLNTPLINSDDATGLIVSVKNDCLASVKMT